ncbi:MAG TPA: hypothetical protein VFW34_02525 [Candidatus Rubrimentiphilum sp.]|nr:hypothetical protein [Candidatus Rubrimentiphilum sp.]
MYKRSMTAAGMCFFVLAVSIIAAAAAPPKYVGLQYDEIARMVIAPATAPPPGTFADAYQKILADAPAAGTSTPAPRRGGLFGGLLSSISNASAQAEEAGNQMQAAINDGTLTRLAYYNGWVRTDNIVAKTAVIDKCDRHQAIELDLARKTYKLIDTSSSGVAAACVAVQQPMGLPQRVNEAPGTVDLTVTSKSVNLGPRTLQGIPTHGSTDTTQMAMTNATGSCTNGSFGAENERYVSNIAVPRRMCPLPKGGGPATPVDMVVQGGCKPTMHGSATGMYWMRTGDKLEMYNRMTMLSGQSAGQFQSVMQRGNVVWLTKPQADALFSIPPGFTQAQ